MAKGKKSKPTKTKTVTLKMAKSCVELTHEGKRRLNLSFKEVTLVPKCIQKFSDIDEMDLSRNLIGKLPDFTDNLISICVLDLHSNYVSMKLEELPATVGRLQNLLVLNLCNNRLRSLPSELGLLRKLHTLNLGLNLLDSLPTSFGDLQELRQVGLSDNRFARVPGCLSRLKHLEKVNLDRNPFSSALPCRSEPLLVKERHYLVRESFLCQGCLSKCQTERRKLQNVGGKRSPFK